MSLSAVNHTFLAGLTAFQLYSVIHDLAARKKHNQNAGLITTDTDDSRQLSPLAIAMCDGYNAVIEFRKSSFISADNLVSAALGLFAFMLPQYKQLSNDLHALQILKYAGYSVRQKSKKAGLIHTGSEGNWFKRFGLEMDRGWKQSKDMAKKLPQVNQWAPKLAKSPIRFFKDNNHNFFLVKAIGELFAGAMIVGSDLLLIRQEKLSKEKARHDLYDEPVIPYEGELSDQLRAVSKEIINTNNIEEKKKGWLEFTNNIGWNIVKVLYFINAAAWIATAVGKSESGVKKKLSVRASETGLGIAKGIHATFANNPSLAFTARALERFFYLMNSSLERVGKGNSPIKPLGGKK